MLAFSGLVLPRVTEHIVPFVLNKLFQHLFETQVSNINAPLS